MKRFARYASLVLISVMITEKFAYGDEIGNTKNGQSLANNCMACHGSNGDNTVSTTTPKLAQQIKQYIVKQLHDFKSGARRSSIMSSMAGMLSDQDMLDVAAYFSSRKMNSVDIDSKSPSAKGEMIYKGGVQKSVKSKSIPACSSCHGLDSNGIVPAFPRLAGQHPQYLISQLKAFQNGTRTNDQNDIMRDIASRLTGDQIKAVAEYLGTL